MTLLVHLPPAFLPLLVGWTFLAHPVVVQDTAGVWEGHAFTVPATGLYEVSGQLWVESIGAAVPVVTDYYATPITPTPALIVGWGVSDETPGRGYPFAHTMQPVTQQAPYVVTTLALHRLIRWTAGQRVGVKAYATQPGVWVSGAAHESWLSIRKVGD